VDLHSAMWRKSSRSSGGGNGDCVEVADLGEVVAVRDSKHPEGTVLTFTVNEWKAFIERAKVGEFDLS
jgi:Domain of unknown function (DUF397)